MADAKTGTTAATLEEARDPARWGRAGDGMLIVFAKKVGKENARDLLGEAIARAIPPNGEEPWPYAAGTPLEDHLEAIMERGRSKLRRYWKRTGGGSPEAVENSAAAASLSPEQRNVHQDLLRQLVVRVRTQFAADPAVLAYFEYLLRPSDETKAAVPVGDARYRAHDRLMRFVTPLRKRLEDESPSGMSATA
jgi:hypothetical protein